MITPSAAAHKVSRAQNLVVVWSPWWHVYLTKCDFTYVYDDSLSIMGSSSLVMTVGLEFIQSHNLMDIAIALEFALQQSLRFMDSRAQRYEEDHPAVRRDIIGLGQSLEINDDINKKFSSVSEYQWIDIASKVIDKSYLASYDATNPPHLPEGWLIPEDFGFDSGLTAEKYIQMIIDKNEREEEEHLNHNEEDDNQDESSNAQDENNNQQQDGDEESFSPPVGGESGEGKAGDSGRNTGSSQGENTPSDSSTPEQGDETSSHNNKEEENSSHDSSYSDDKNSSHGDAENSSDKNSFMQQPPSPFRGDYSHDEHHASPANTDSDMSTPPPVNTQPHRIDNPQQQENGTDKENHSSGEKEDDLSSIEQSISQSYDDMHSDIPQREKSSPQSQSLNKEESEEVENPWEGKEGKPSGQTSPQSSSSPDLNQQDDMTGIEAHLADEMDVSTPQGTQEDHDELQKEYQHLMDRAKDSVGESGEHNFDIPQHRQDTSAVGISAEERSELDKELAESIQEHNDSLPKNGGFTAGDSFIAWSNEKLRKPVVPWQKVLRKLVTLSVSRAQMAGQSDLSYAKQNPNQQPDMPIMMGFVTYPPEVTVLVDASPSMLRRKKKTISEFAGVVQKILIQYSQPVVMAAADNSIKYVAYSTSPAHSIVKNIGKTFDGSSAKFGDTVARVAKKGVKFRGRNYPSPDVLILFTDCLFHWPLAENARLPLSYATVIVASTEPYEDVKDYLPHWVKEKKNFVHISD